MADKQQLLTLLREELDTWEALLAGLSEAELTAPRLPDPWSIKDDLAHLMAWQQRSIIRVEAALQNRQPAFPGWPTSADTDDDPLETNAWIYAQYRDQSWAQVYAAWRAGFLRLIELADAVPERDLLDPGKYAWLDGEPLAIVLEGTYEHHQIDHLEPLQRWLEQRRAGPDAEK